MRVIGYKDIIKLQQITGTKAKEAFIKEHEDDEYFKSFLYYALNPMLTYNVSEKTLAGKPNEFTRCSCENIFEMCEYLSSYKAIASIQADMVKVLLNRLPDEEERNLYIKLLAKTVRLGVTAKTVNKIIPGLIPEWEVQQAYQLEKCPIKPGTEFWLTQKLNGVRATLYKGKIYARSGIPFKGLEHIINELIFFVDNGFVFDGELIIKDKKDYSDNEAFRITTGIVNSDSESKKEICFNVFDIIRKEDFDSDNPQETYLHRRGTINLIRRIDFDYVNFVPVLYHGTDQSVIPELLQKMVDEDKEGLMLNLNVPYYRKRHRGILKIKRFYTMDLKVVDCEEGSGRLSGKLGSLVVDFKGNEVRVGSGFSDEQRIDFWKRKDEIVGKICEVKYKEISYDKKTGNESLQFPVFVGLRFDKDTESYS